MTRFRAFLKVLLPVVLFTGHSSAASLAAQDGAAATGIKPGVTGSSPTASVLVDLEYGGPIKTMHLAVGRSLIVTTKTPLKRIYVGNPLVMQSFSSGAQEVVLTAKAYGLSNVVLWDQMGHSQMYSFSADMDCEEVRSAFEGAFPGLTLDMETRQGKLFLNGDVPSDLVQDAVLKMATSYTKEVVNGMRVVVPHGKQVELKLKIVEVDRSKAEQFGINIARPGGNIPGSISTQQFPSTVTVTPASGTTPPTVTASDPLNLFLYSFSAGYGLTIKDLESKHILQVLAEPTLTTMSGLAARFLSGGEFPVPVVQGGTGNSTAITVVYRPYGVKVDFTPTVNKDGTIHLKVSPEVSTLDYTNSVTLSGTTVPALSTRRAETEVEIRNGESFMVSGLLDHRVTDTFSSVPFLGTLPYIGQFFRSKDITRSVVELVVLVTATVVDPLAHPAVPVEPKMPLPNMDTEDFDRGLRKLGKDFPSNGPDEKAPAAPPAAKVPTVEVKPAQVAVPTRSQESPVQIVEATQQEADQAIDVSTPRSNASLVQHEPQDRLPQAQVIPNTGAEPVHQWVTGDSLRAVVTSRVERTENR